MFALDALQRVVVRANAERPGQTSVISAYISENGRPTLVVGPDLWEAVNS